MLAADLGGERFMTMHLSVVDARAGTFRWASAGHDAAIIFDPAADRFAEERRAAGFPLGLMDDAGFSEETFGPLREGQVITVGTDGVWETPNAAGEQFGKPRLRAAILESLAKFRGDCRPVDDVTFVVVKVLALGQPPTAAPP